MKETGQKFVVHKNGAGNVHMCTVQLHKREKKEKPHEVSLSFSLHKAFFPRPHKGGGRDIKSFAHKSDRRGGKGCVWGGGGEIQSSGVGKTSEKNARTKVTPLNFPFPRPVWWPFP